MSLLEHKFLSENQEGERRTMIFDIPNMVLHYTARSGAQRGEIRGKGGEKTCSQGEEGIKPVASSLFR